MSNDIGMIKAAFPSAVQTGPAAAVERPVGVARTPPLPGSPAAQAGRSAQAERAEQDRAPLDDVVSELNDMVRELHRELRFSVDGDSGDTVIKVIDRETEEVVRQIPSEEVVRLRKRLQEAAGVIFRDSA